MQKIKPTLTIHIPTDDPEIYTNELEVILRQMIVSSVDQKQAECRYQKAGVLFPIWLELNPPERVLKSMEKVLKVHQEDAQASVKRMLKMLKIEGKIRKMDRKVKNNIQSSYSVKPKP